MAENTRVIKVLPDNPRQARASSIKMRCADCIYMDEKVIHPVYKQSCPERGILPKAYAPSCFVPDVRPINKIGHDALDVMGVILGTCSQKQIRVLLALMVGQHKLQERGLHLMQKVYFCTVAERDAYLTDWYCGYVLSYNNGAVRLSSRPELGEISRSFISEVIPSSLYSEQDFEVIKQNLIDSARINPPKSPKKIDDTLEGYQVPTLDLTPELVEILNTHRTAASTKRSAPKRPQKQASGKAASLQDLLKASSQFDVE